jgi:hypothetical protein
MLGVGMRTARGLMTGTRLWPATTPSGEGIAAAVVGMHLDVLQCCVGWRGVWLSRLMTKTRLWPATTQSGEGTVAVCCVHAASGYHAVLA